MKLWIWSDLHLEQQHVQLPPVAPDGAEMIVCAGDWAVAGQLESQMYNVVRAYDLPIIFVAGNHEYQGELSFEASRNLMAMITEKSKSWNQRVHILDNEYLAYKDIVFIGGTLWTDFLYLADNPAELPWRIKEAEFLIRDFSVIRMETEEAFSPSLMLRQHRITSSFIHETTKLFARHRKVVVSHHIPHGAASDIKYQHSAANYLYTSSAAAFENLMHSAHAPDIWICGHTHQVTDVQIGKTRIISNPYGYQRFKNERQNGFSWDYIVEV